MVIEYVPDRHLDFDATRALDIIRQYKGKRGSLISVLQKIQDAYGYLPEPLLDLVAEGLNVYLTDVYGVVTFYAQFYLTPRGKNVVRICRGTACHVKGSDRIMEKLLEKLEVKPGEMTRDGNFTIEEVACLGACGMAPVMVVNKETYGEVTPAKSLEVIEAHSAKKETK
ncbi:MAG: NADH-quinone oxidoreductase subunit NuoE [bacterium]